VIWNEKNLTGLPDQIFCFKTLGLSVQKVTFIKLVLLEKYTIAIDE